MPLWHCAQVPGTTPAWSNLVAGIQNVVLWHESHDDAVGRCVGDLPVAFVPLWHWAHDPGATEAWLKVAGSHTMMRWQESSAEDAAGRILSFRWLPYAAIAVAFVVPAITSWSDVAMLEQHIPASGVLIVLVLIRLAAVARQNAELVASGAARRTEARFRALVQNASDVVALTDVDSGVR